jgi:hypothetical protein
MKEVYLRNSDKIIITALFFKRGQATIALPPVRPDGKLLLCQASYQRHCRETGVITIGTFLARDNVLIEMKDIIWSYFFFN